MQNAFFFVPFELDGRQWNSLNIIIKQQSLRKRIQNFMLHFLDKPSNLSKDPRLAKAAGGKSGKTKIDGRLLN